MFNNLYSLRDLNYVFYSLFINIQKLVINVNYINAK